MPSGTAKSDVYDVNHFKFNVTMPGFESYSGIYVQTGSGTKCGFNTTETVSDTYYPGTYFYTQYGGDAFMYLDGNVVVEADEWMASAGGSLNFRIILTTTALNNDTVACALVDYCDEAYIAYLYGAFFGDQSWYSDNYVLSSTDLSEDYDNFYWRFPNGTRFNATIECESTADPTVCPTPTPTASPTLNPTTEPTEQPTADPTVDPTKQPTATPTAPQGILHLQSSNAY